MKRCPATCHAQLNAARPHNEAHACSSPDPPPWSQISCRHFQDTGIKAIVSGLVIAQAKMLLASSLNDPATKDSPEAAECQKPFSGYIQLIVKWRTGFFRVPADSTVRLFPFGDAVVSTPATTTDSESVAERDGEGETVSEVEGEGGGEGGEGSGVEHGGEGTEGEQGMEERDGGGQRGEEESGEGGRLVEVQL